MSLLFSLVPLLEVRRVKPLLLLRGGTTARSAGRRRGHPGVVDERRGSARGSRDLDWMQVAAAVIVGGALVGVASWQAASLRRRDRLRRIRRQSRSCCTRGPASSARCGRSRRRRWFPLRHAVLSLGRPGNQTRVILLAVGLGSFFVLGVRALQANLLAAVLVELRRAARTCS